MFGGRDTVDAERRIGYVRTPKIMKDKYEYNYQPCNICGRLSVDPHHCLVGKKKGQPWRDHWYNIEWLCRDCHREYANAYEHRRWFFEQRVRMYGQAFLDWWDSLPMKVKPRYE